MGQLIKVGIQLRKEEDSLLWGVNPKLERHCAKTGYKVHVPNDAPLTPASGGRPKCGK